MRNSHLVFRSIHYSPNLYHLMNSLLKERVYQFNFLASWDDDILDLHLEGIPFWVSTPINSLFHEYSVSRKMQELVLLGCKSQLDLFLHVTQSAEMAKPQCIATVCTLQFVKIYRGWWWIEMLQNGEVLLILWCWNFLLNFSTSCILNVNNTGSKQGSIMK
jgi:hypothetical protein